MPVDLRSDTVTLPTAAMKQAMVDAPLGDDVFGEDPTTKRLEAIAAERAGKEAALFTASGTMANQLAIAVHTRRGDEVLMEQGAHPFNFEAGGAAVLSGVQIRTLAGVKGVMRPEDVTANVRRDNDHYAPTRLLCVEDTSNRGGGTVHTMDQLSGLTLTARQHGLRVHLDGARVWNAVVASGISLDRRVRSFDTVSFCFSKGLGAPVGSVLCGPKALIAEARRVRKMIGGGMRQSGMLAAAAIYALEHHVDRLADDHARARKLSMGLMIDGFDVQLPETNIVYVTVPDAHALVAALRQKDVWVNATAPNRIRLVTHLNVDDEAIDKALAAFAAHKP